MKERGEVPFTKEVNILLIITLPQTKIIQEINKLSRDISDDWCVKYDEYTL